MSARRLLRWSVHSYGVLLIALAVTAGTGVLGWSMVRLHEVSRATEAHYREQARVELEFALNQVLAEADQIAARLVEWDEVRQQFNNPAYYGYWKRSRAAAQATSPPLLDLELYDRDGAPLARTPAAGMPPRVRTSALGARLVREGDRLYLYDASPIDLDGGPEPRRHGFLVLKLDFALALRNSQNFRYVSVESLDNDLRDGGAVPAEAILPHLRFSLVPNPEFDAVEALAVDSTRRLAILAAAVALIFLALLFAAIGVPLRRLSQHVDYLRRGGIRQLPRPALGPLRLQEFEKLRSSLNDYQQQLFAQGRALRESEARMRAVLDSLRDGILTLDRDGIVRSANPACGKLFGRPAADLLDTPFEHLLAPDEGSALVTSLRGHSSGDAVSVPVFEGESFARDRRGEAFSVELLVSALGTQGSPSFLCVVRDITERKRSEARLHYMANYDAVTGLPNRTMFSDRLGHAIAHARREDQCVGVIFLDLDDFKRVNDSLGHHIGDKLLMAVAERLNASLRQDDTVARLGGDEFTVVLENIGSPPEAGIAAAKLLEALTHPFDLGPQRLFVTTSIGITTYPADGVDVDALLKNADTAMYRAKELGGNQFQFFTRGMQEQIDARLRLESDLRQAVVRDEFELHYQPKMDLAGGRLSGVEALLRWRHPERGLQMPSSFIPMLEESGLIVDVGEWVLREACAQARRWRDEGLGDLRLAVNLSARQFQQPDLVARVATVLEETGFDAAMLELELTEGMLVANVEEATAVLDALSRRGIGIAVDDFGTGYSSLYYLKRFPIRSLKIDQSFVRDMIHDADDAAIVELVIATARSLRLSTTAEGVETPAQLERLRQLGCHEAQGYLIGAALPPDEIEAVLRGGVAAG